MLIGGGKHGRHKEPVRKRKTAFLQREKKTNLKRGIGKCLVKRETVKGVRAPIVAR